MSLPLNIRPELGSALVVGGGEVATRKVLALCDAGFSVDVVSPEISDEIEARPTVTPHYKPFAPSDLKDHVLVFACTDVRAVNREVGQLARGANIPVDGGMSSNILSEMHGLE